MEDESPGEEENRHKKHVLANMSILSQTASSGKHPWTFFNLGYSRIE